MRHRGPPETVGKERGRELKSLPTENPVWAAHGLDASPRLLTEAPERQLGFQSPRRSLAPRSFNVLPPSLDSARPTVVCSPCRSVPADNSE